MVRHVPLVELKRIFSEALEHAPARRAAFLESACYGNADVRRKIDRMLEAHTRSGGLLDAPTGVNAGAVFPEADGALPALPERIAGHRITRLIARGGMGTVYEAVQESPSRVVALKVVNDGVGGRSAARRFEHESQVLARLRHPGIAQIFGAGVHDTGGRRSPYFVMEYIPNARAFTRYVAEEKLSTRERLALFTQVCEAVHHGHQKGVIHRDLKPDNILVDASGQPKIIDFGVARATDVDVAVTTMRTDVGDLIGTVQYMSPDQVAADPHDIDTRSDVYSLGVVLYEVLTGAPPYEVSGRPIYEATRVIREQAPLRPSAIDASLRGDVETIVLMALEKDRSRRYQSANELGGDIRRYLQGEAIHARPPSAWYQTRLFLRRHKGLAAATVAIVLAVASGGVAATVGMLTAQRERDDAESLANVLTSALASADPMVAQGRDVTVREVLDDLAARLEPGAPFAVTPIRRARIQTTIGIAYRHLGHFEDGARHLRAAYETRRDGLGETHEETLTTLYELGRCLQRSDEWDEAAACYQSILDLYDAGAIPKCYAVAASLRGMGVISQVPDEQGEYASRALDMFRELLGEENLDVALCLNNLGWVEIRKGNCEKAIEILEQAHTMRQRTLGPDHPHVAQSFDGISEALKSLRRFEEAAPYLREAYELRRRVLGADHPHARNSLHYYAMLVLNRLREYEAAEPLFREALALSRRHGTWRGLGVRFTLFGLGWSLSGQGRVDEAEPLLREAIELLDTAEEGVGEGMILAAALESVYGSVLVALERYEEAERFLTRAHARLERDGSERATEFARRDHVQFLGETIDRLVHLYDAWEKPEKAAEWRAKRPDGVETDEEAADGG